MNSKATQIDRKRTFSMWMEKKLNKYCYCNYRNVCSSSPKNLNHLNSHDACFFGHIDTCDQSHSMWFHLFYMRDSNTMNNQCAVKNSGKNCPFELEVINFNQVDMWSQSKTFHFHFFLRKSSLISRTWMKR